jgi:thioredoxin 1
MNHYTDDDFEQLVLRSERPVLVGFRARWCGPSKVAAPILEEIAAEMADRLTVGTLDVDDHPASAARYGVRGVPTLMLFRNGAVAATRIGALPKRQLETWLESVL